MVADQPELDPAALPNPELLPQRLRDRDLPFAGN